MKDKVDVQQAFSRVLRDDPVFVKSASAIDVMSSVPIYSLVDPTERLCGTASGDDFKRELGTMLVEEKARKLCASLVFARADLKRASRIDAIERQLLSALLTALRASNPSIASTLDDHLGHAGAWNDASLDLFRREWLRPDRQTAISGIVLAIDGFEQLRHDLRASAAAAIANFSEVVRPLCTLIVTQQARIPRFHEIRVKRLDYTAFCALLTPPKSATPPEGNSRVPDEKAEPRGFWARLTQLVSGFLSEDSLESTANRADVELLPDERRLRNLVYLACYPSHRKLDLVQQALRRYSRSESPVKSTSQGVDGAARNVENGEIDMQERIAFSALSSAVFLNVLKIAFPKLMHAAETDDEGTYRLYLLLSSFTERRVRPEELAALEAEPWKSFRSDDLLHNCCRFAFSKGSENKEPLVTPFSSTRALQQHLDGLVDLARDDDADYWDRRVLKLNDIVIATIDRATETTREHRKTIRHSDENVDRLTHELVAKTRSGGAKIDDIARIVRELDAYNTAGDEAKKALQEIEQEGLPAALSDWLAETNRHFNDHTGLPLLPADTLNELGQRHLSLLEIWCSAGGDVLSEDLDIIRTSLNRCIEFLREALDRTHGAVAFEAQLGLARANALGARLFERNADMTGSRFANERDEALAGAAALTRSYRERVLTVELTRAMLEEHGKSWTDAERRYLGIHQESEQANYIEVAARAGYAAMRARQVQTCKDERRPLFWAQGFLRLQMSRSPFFANTSKSLFVSYRRDTQPWVARFCEAMEGKSNKGEVKNIKLWVDYESIIDVNMDYRAEMQVGLDHASFVILVLSPGYFESPWCTYELTTALARRRLNNQRVAWICIDGRCPKESQSNPKEHVRNLARGAVKFAADERFFETQLKEVLELPTLASEVIKVQQDGKPDDTSEGNKLLEKILDQYKVFVK